MTYVRSVVVSEVLCFLIHKKGRSPEKSLKSFLFEFYTGDIILAAKYALFEAVSTFKIDGCPTLRKRRESKESPDLKVRADIDDLVALVTFVDENKVSDKLPIFVAANPDLIPSPRLLEGDLLVLINKLTNIEECCYSL